MSTVDGQPEGLFQFLEWAARTGEMNPTTARAWHSTARRVLSVLEDGEDTTLRTMDTAAVFRRFEALNRTKYSTGSMHTYGVRFTNAVEAYLRYLDKDPSWRPERRNSSAKARGRKNGAVVSEERPAEDASVSEQAPEVTAPAPGSGTRLVTYTLPLRPDMLVRLDLPVDLMRHDAERVAAFVRSLAFDDSRADGQPQ